MGWEEFEQMERQRLRERRQGTFAEGGNNHQLLAIVVALASVEAGPIPPPFLWGGWAT